MLGRDDFDELSRYAAELGRLDRRQAAIAFGAALGHSAHAREWFEAANGLGVDVWAVLRHAVRRDQTLIRPAEAALQLMGELADPRGFSMLEDTLDDPQLAPSAFGVLTRTPGEAAVALLERAAGDDDKAVPAIDALRRARTSLAVEALARIVRGGGSPALRAGIALDTLATETAVRKGRRRVPADVRRIAREAQSALAAVVASQGEELFRSALRDGLQARFWFDQARRNKVDVWDILRATVTEAATPPVQRDAAIQLLTELDTPRARSLLKDLDEGSGIAPAPPMIRGRPAPPAGHGEGLPEDDWELLLERIATGRCLPILGPGASVPALPTSAELAALWADRYDYPFDDRTDLARVAQYVAARLDPLFTKEALVKDLLGARGHEPPETYRVLAELPFRLYVTANFDDLLTEALRLSHRSPRTEVSRWLGLLRLDADLSSGDPDFEPTVEEPVVHHVYGHLRVPESMVLTEDDYLDFLIAVSRDPPTVVPRVVTTALSRDSLLFVGFSESDLSFRIFNRGLVISQASLRSQNWTVQLAPDTAAEAYLEGYFRSMSTRIYWGASDDFARELSARWKHFANRA